MTYVISMWIYGPDFLSLMAGIPKPHLPYGPTIFGTIGVTMQRHQSPCSIAR